MTDLQTFLAAFVGALAIFAYALYRQQKLVNELELRVEALEA